MTYRRAFILVLLALGLWSYLLLWELPSPTKEEQLDQSIAVLPQAKEKIASLSFVSGESRLTLNKQAERWVVVAPVLDDAETLLVEALVTQLDAARASRIFTEEDPAFGINKDSASLQITFQDNSKETLLVGADAVGGSLFYAFRSDTKQVLLLPKPLKTLIAQDPALFRAQQALPIRREQIEEVSLRSAARTLTLQKDGTLWWQISPKKGRVDPAKMEALLRSFEALRVDTFIEAKELTGEERELTLKTKEGERSLSLFGPIEANGEKTYIAKRQSATFQIEASLIDALWSQPEELRDQKVFTPLQNVSSIQFQAGARSLRLFHDDTGWRSDPRAEIDPREVDIFFDQLEKFVVKSFAEEGIIQPASMRGEEPSLTMEFADKTTQRFAIEGAASEGFVWITRGAERIEVSSSLAELMAPDVLRFRPKLLLKVLPSTIKEIVIERDGATTQLERRGSAWWQKYPIEAMADQRAVEGMLVVFEELRAASFLPKEAQPTLDKPLAKITIKTADGDHTIAFGDTWRERERLARVDSQEVCALSPSLWLALGASWAEHRAFVSLALEGLQAVTLTQGSTKVSLQKTESGWVGAAQKAYSKILVDKLLQEIADITADEVVAFDEKRAAQYGMSSPSFTGELQTKTETTIFSLGGIADEKKRHALRVNNAGPLFLLSEEEVSYLKLPSEQ